MAVVNTTLTASPGALALFSTNSLQTIIVPPRQAVEVTELPLLYTAAFKAYAPDPSRTLTTWLPLFSLQPNASLIISNTVAYSNPLDASEVCCLHRRV